MGNSFFSMYWVYAIVSVLSIFFAYLAQTKYTSSNGLVRSKVNLIFFFLSFAIPWAVIGFTRIGADYANYEMIIDRLDWTNLGDQGDSEYGFNMIAMALKSLLGGNVHGTIFLLKTITIVCIFASIYWMQDKLNIAMSVMFYLFMLYLPSFYLLSQCLAASLVVLVTVFFFRKGKLLLSLALLVAIGFVHNSVFLYIPFFFICAYGKPRKIQVEWLVALFIVAIVFSESIYRFAQTIEGFHYNNYMRSESAGTGLVLYSWSVVMMFLVYQMFKYDTDVKRSSFLMYYSAAICLFRILGMNFDVISRMELDFIFVYIILFPSYLRYHRETKKESILYAAILLFMLYNGYHAITNRIGSPFSMMNYYIPINPFE